MTDQIVPMQARGLRFALRLAEMGYRVFPVRKDTKLPAINDWPNLASNDELDIISMFNRRDLDVGIACGPQPNGVNLVVVDVDCKDGKVGWDSWDELWASDFPPEGPMVGTPSKGAHFYYDAPREFRNNRNEVGPDIDIRGTGGYVKVYEDGMLNFDRPIPGLPARVMEALGPKDVSKSVARHPSQVDHGDGPSPLDYVREHFDWLSKLPEHGWVLSHIQGDMSFWTRPGKSAKDGHSACLHPNGRFSCWSTQVDVRGLGHTNSDGSVSLSLAEFIAIYEFGGDLKALARYIRAEYMAPAAVVPYRTGDTTASADAEAHAGSRGASTAPNLPPEFWEARPWLTHLRDAAFSRMVTPDAVLIALFSRMAARTRPWIGLMTPLGPATFDYIGTIVGESSSGKSAAMRLASELMPNQYDNDDKTLWEKVPSSGEGMLEGYYALRPDPDNPKAPKERTRWRHTLHLQVPEMMSMLSQATRAGNIMLPEMCKAWSGETLGTLNAEQAKIRDIPQGKYRFSLICGIQASLASDLVHNKVIKEQGITGRMVFASAHLATPPPRSALPSWPGPLEIYIPFGSEFAPMQVTFDPEIGEEIQDLRYAGWPGGADVATGHILPVCKLAALFALADEMFHVEQSHWELAKLVRANSEAIVEWIRQLHQVRQDQEDNANADRQARRELRVTDVKAARQMHTWAVKIQRLASVEGGVTKGRCRVDFASSQYREHFEEALALAVANGFVKDEGARIVAVQT